MHGAEHFVIDDKSHTRTEIFMTTNVDNNSVRAMVDVYPGAEARLDFRVYCPPDPKRATARKLRGIAERLTALADALDGLED